MYDMTTTTESTTWSHPPLYESEVMPHISRFIDAGGAYREVSGVVVPRSVVDTPRKWQVEVCEGPYQREVVDNREALTIYGVLVSYNGRSVLLANYSTGAPAITLLLPNELDTGFIWTDIKVSNQELDTVLYGWFRCI